MPELSSLTAADWVDIGCAALVLVSIGVGAFRGLSGELPAEVGWILGALAGWWLYAPAHTFFSQLGALAAHPWGVVAAAAATAVLLAWGAGALIRLGLGRLMKAVAKQPIDHILGTVAGLVRAVLLLLVATTAMLLLPWRTGHEVFCHASRTGRAFVPWATELIVTAHTLCPRVKLERAEDPGEAVTRDEERTSGRPRPARPTNGAAPAAP